VEKIHTKQIKYTVFGKKATPEPEKEGLHTIFFSKEERTDAKTRRFLFAGIAI